MPTNRESERLLREEQRKNLLCGGLAGEIQQVAQGIMLARETVEMRSRSQTLPEDYVRSLAPVLEDMDICVRYLNYIAENLTDLTVRFQNQLTPRMQPVELAWQWNQMAGLIAECGPEGRRVEWTCGCPEGRFILADQAWVDKVFLNLLMNALRYTDGPVRASLLCEEEVMRLVVEDDGPGLSPQLQDCLFRPFSPERVTDRGRHGVGLGLYLAREYSLAMGWQFKFDSGPEGTRVELVIPPSSLEPENGTTLRSYARSLALRSEQLGRLKAARSGMYI
ncbi:MAG TPA: hypothetical protein H9795_04525 [Candidatus Fournierella merdigallinarum]|nr:hypothetical protein [Candidatus Fournierella merdigallinarum]